MRLQIITFILIMAIAGFIIATLENSPKSLTYLAFTDKTNYSQGEQMELELKINSDNQKQVLIEIHGIKNSGGTYYLNIRDRANLSKGENIFKFPATIPHCTKCSGISKGEHPINFIVMEEGKVLFNETQEILIT